MPDAPPPARPASLLSGADLGLYGVTVVVWGTSWIALKHQVGAVAPEVSTLWRFLLAAGLMLAWVAWRGERMRFPAADHARFAVAGVLIFSSNFVLFLYGAASVPSGLLAVVFSLASIVNLALGAALMRQPVEPRVALGGVLGVLGIGLLYAPQIGETGEGALAGLGLCVAGTLSFCLGNLAAASIQRRNVPLLAANTWGMVYGVVWLAALAAWRGQAFTIETRADYLAGLVYLAVFASVVAFACYLTLLRRIGAARAGYATVLFPIVALGISTLAEGYRWTLLAGLGVACALLGNLLVLRRPGS